MMGSEPATGASLACYVRALSLGASAWEQGPLHSPIGLGLGRPGQHHEPRDCSMCSGVTLCTSSRFSM